MVAVIQDGSIWTVTVITVAPRSGQQTPTRVYIVPVNHLFKRPVRSAGAPPTRLARPGRFTCTSDTFRWTPKAWPARASSAQQQWSSLCSQQRRGVGPRVSPGTKHQRPASECCHRSTSVPASSRARPGVRSRLSGSERYMRVRRYRGWV